MIVTLTLNPAIDKTARIDALCPRGLNRLGQVERDVGGKGVNVSKMLAALGQDSIACGFAAGQAGRAVVEALRAWPGGHITPDFVALPGETRTNLKLVEPDGDAKDLELSIQSRVPSGGQVHPGGKYLRIQVFRMPAVSFFARPVPLVFYSSLDWGSNQSGDGTYRGPPAPFRTQKGGK